MVASRKKQWALIVICCMAYGFAYAGRYGYNANIAPIMAYYGVTRAEAGLVSTCFFFAYGATQLVHGILCRFYPKKYVVPAALFLSAGFNLAVYFLPPFAAIKYLCLLNGICQSVLWPSLVLTLGETLEPGMMKQAVFVISLATMFGTLISYGGSALFNLFSFFRGSFLLGAGLTVLIGLIWFCSYDVLTADRYVPEQTETDRQTGARSRADGALIGLLAVSILFAAVCNFVKDGLSTWTPVILKEQFSLGDSASIVLTLILPVFGLFGSVLALAVNRRIRDYCQLSGVFYVALSLCVGGLLLTFRGTAGVVPTLVLLGVISCLAYAINNVVTSMMPLQMRGRINSGFLAGLMNSATYIGSTASAYGLGRVADGAGWNAVIEVLLCASILSAVIAGFASLLRTLKRRRNGTTQ